MNWEEYCKGLGIGSRFFNASLSTCDKLPQEIQQAATLWKENPHSLVLSGEAGRGKTYLAVAMFRHIEKAKGAHSVIWTKSKTFDDKMLDAIKEYGSAPHMMEEYKTVPYLFVDDFGVDRSSERIERDYYEILDARWSSKLPTILTTNLGLTSLQKVYGERIFSRLKDFKWILFKGADLRGKHD